MEDLERDLIDLEPGQSLEKGRPAFLSGLCITSWAGCGLLFIYNIYMIYVMMAYSSEFVSLGFVVINYLIQLAGLLIVAVAVLGIWHLKKWGYFLYLFGELGAPIAGFVMSAMALDGMLSNQVFGLDLLESYLFSFGGVTGFWIPVIFCIAYGTHYKFLK